VFFVLVVSSRCGRADVTVQSKTEERQARGLRNRIYDCEAISTDITACGTEGRDTAAQNHGAL